VIGSDGDARLVLRFSHGGDARDCIGEKFLVQFAKLGVNGSVSELRVNRPSGRRMTQSPCIGPAY
jgi:hypothetical protein